MACLGTTKINGDIVAYAGTYDSNDLDDIVIDGIGTAGVQVIAFVSIMVIMVLIIWGKDKLNM